MPILLLFIDGLGLGPSDPPTNPLLTASMPQIRCWLEGRPLSLPSAPYHGAKTTLLALDACLGIPGLPQSATGQAALFTGVNAPRLLGHHLHAFPTGRLKTLLAEQSLLRSLHQAGKAVTSANAYSPDYFEQVARRKFRHSASTLAVLAAGLPLRQDLAALAAGNAVYQDLTNLHLQERGFAVPLISPEKAGQNLAGIVSVHDFTLFEYFQTDRAGHSRDRQWAETILQQLDAFLGALLASLDLSRILVIVTSDHGNIEDITSKPHTLNPVPCLLLGAAREQAAENLDRIDQVAPMIFRLLTGSQTAPTG
ncbi:MAG TPA: alkaline phosphatase family protein [Patescibacteria group bacterium]|nr:alkaline phosphatase family protein [Patescibacteria group bacterium]